MNDSNLADSQPEIINAVSFNQDYSCISVATSKCFRVYNVDPFNLLYDYLQEQSPTGTAIAQMLFTTSLVAFVADGHDGSPRCLKLINTKRQSTIVEVFFVNTILKVVLNRKRLVAVLESAIHVYDISSMKQLHVMETPANPLGLASLSSTGNDYLTFPATGLTGEVLIFDCLSLQTVNLIQCHKSPLAAMELNMDGSLLATASTQGTVIRVSSIPDGSCLYQFRRGSLSARITHLNFSQQFVIVISESDTLHVFKLEGQTQKNQLPEMLSSMLAPVRDFASLKLPANTKGRCVAAVYPEIKHVVVVSKAGYMLQYQIDIVNGGECVLLKQYSLTQ